MARRKKRNAMKKRKFKRCVKKVKAKDKQVKSPYAVCFASVYGKKKKKKR